jgi:hypothetical protein
MIGTFTLWLLATVFSFVYRVATLCTFARPATRYEEQWDYQLTMFVFLDLPLRLLGLGIALGILSLIFRRRRSPDSCTEPPC